MSGVFIALIVILLVLLTACGSHPAYNPEAVTVTVSPASATIAVNGQIGLQASVHGLCSTCLGMVGWSVEENGTYNCSWITVVPTDPCPGGIVQYPDVAGVLNATYLAPSSPGTFHVTAKWSFSITSPTVTKQGMSVITVQ